MYKSDIYMKYVYFLNVILKIFRVML